jgi:hypothetical protein
MAKNSTPSKGTPTPKSPVAVPKNIPDKSGKIGLNTMPKYQNPPPPPPKGKD